MPLIDQVSIKNFKGYREEVTISLSNSTYFLGANNSGKSAILHAVRCFFDETKYSHSYLNKTEQRSKKEGANRSEVSIIIDTAFIKAKKTGERLIKRFGPKIKLSKHFIYREIAGTIEVRFFINATYFEPSTIDKDIKKILDGVNVSYIHPQEAEELLVRAQRKLRERLLANFGRHHSVATNLKNLQESWSELRRAANEWLSKSLTESLQKIWPHCESRIDLPAKIDEIIAVSDISFRSSGNVPPVELTNQGTGAQSTILYQAHYLIDSDKTLHQGQYHALWLIEEPESFLHSDLTIKLGALLNGDEWLSNIQMMITTHDSNIVGTARPSSENVRIALIEDHAFIKNEPLSQWAEIDIKRIAEALGDPYFDVVFYSVSSGPSVILEDAHERSKAAFARAGIAIQKQLNGISEVRRYIDVLSALGVRFQSSIFFIVDADKGLREIKAYIDHPKKRRTNYPTGISRISLPNNIHIILLPENKAIEGLFDEYEGFLENMANILFGEDYRYAIADASIPAALSRAHGFIRGRAENTKGLEGAKEMLGNLQDIKDQFWASVEASGSNIGSGYTADIKSAIALSPQAVSAAVH